jgi:hypothetical protein
MIRKIDLSRAFSAAIVGSLALSIGLFELQSSFAGPCGGYCKARQVRAICHDVVSSRGLTGYQRNAEFDKCKLDPTTHRRIEEVVDDTREIFD